MTTAVLQPILPIPELFDLLKQGIVSTDLPPINRTNLLSQLTRLEEAVAASLARRDVPSVTTPLTQLVSAKISAN